MRSRRAFALAIVCVFAVAAVASSSGQKTSSSAKKEVEQIRELARMIRQTDSPSELTVQNLLQWLQGKYESSGVRRARQQFPTREYLPSLPSVNDDALNRPRPFRPARPTAAGAPGFPEVRPDHDSLEPGSDAARQDFDFRPGYPQQEETPQRPAVQSTSFPSYSPPTVTPGFAGEEGGNERTGFGPDDLNHPPHIHAIDVRCAKDMMTISIEFNRVFDGVIYSKGFYNSEKCRYVSENSGRRQYTFTVSLDSCGTQFVDQFAQGGQAYLENVLVLQNEPGIQEVWDTVRNVRCLWEGTIRQDVSASLAIGMLTQEVVTFNGDTGKARLDIQVGKGPFAPAANGLVKIGEPMTLVVYVEGDTGFDVIVRSCRARGGAGENSIRLFDERGCVLKPKLFGAFQKTRETGNTGASIIAYAYFSAFKFPDEMDLIIECNVELCKTNCDVCPENDKLEPGRRRRRREMRYDNETSFDFGNTISGRFRVVAEDDLTELNKREHLTWSSDNNGVCMSTRGFLLSSFLVLSLLLISAITSAAMWLKLQKTSREKR